MCFLVPPRCNKPACLAKRLNDDGFGLPAGAVKGCDHLVPCGKLDCAADVGGCLCLLGGGLLSSACLDSLKLKVLARSGFGTTAGICVSGFVTTLCVVFTSDRTVVLAVKSGFLLRLGP